MDGALHWIGAYDYCEEILDTYNVTFENATTVRTIHGQYARMEITLDLVSLVLLYSILFLKQ